MQTFLGDVALRITPALEIHPRVKIIVPTRRAILFLKEELKQTIQSTLFSPEIISIEEFVEDLSGFSLVPKTELHLLFYSLNFQDDLKLLISDYRVTLMFLRQV